MVRSYSQFPLFFFFNDTATTEIYTLSLHDALPICAHRGVGGAARERDAVERHALDATPEELRLLGGESAGVDAHPGDLRRQAAVFDLRAAVHHDLEAVRLREFRGLVVADAKLHPYHLRTRRERERLLHDFDGVAWCSEDINHVDGLGDVGELGVDLAPQQLLPDDHWIDRDHAVTPLEQIFEGEVTRAAGIGGNADHRDCLHGVEDAADVAVVVVVVVHVQRLFALNIGSP